MWKGLKSFITVVVVMEGRTEEGRLLNRELEGTGSDAILMMRWEGAHMYGTLHNDPVSRVSQAQHCPQFGLGASLLCELGAGLGPTGCSAASLASTC